MKTVILAAGYARRMQPLSNYTSKSLLSVFNSFSILDFLVAKIEVMYNKLFSTYPQEADFELYIVSNDLYKLQFEEYISDYYQSSNNKLQDFLQDKSQILATLSDVEKNFILNSQKLKIYFLSDGTLNNEERLGALKDLSLIIKHFSLYDKTLVMAADTLFSFDLYSLAFEFLQHNKLDEKSMLLYQDFSHYDFDKLKNFALISLSDKGKILRLQEKPTDLFSTKALLSFYFYHPSDLLLLDECIANYDKFDSPGVYPEWLFNVKNRNFYLKEIDTLSYDFGDLTTYFRYKNVFCDKKYIF